LKEHGVWEKELYLNSHPDTYWVDKATGNILDKQVSEKKNHVPEEIRKRQTVQHQSLMS
jgi:hypothetical protein